MKKLFGFLISILALAVIAGVCFISYFLMEGTPPTLQISPEPKVIGREYRLNVLAKDNRSGIKSISVYLIQGHKEVPVASKNYPATRWWMGSGVKETRESWIIKPLSLGLGQGKATLRIVATDSTLRRGFKGNQQILNIPLRIDTNPPRIALKSLTHNIAVGGSGLVSYKVSEIPEKTGVRIDNIFFPACPDPMGGKQSYVAMVAIPYNDLRPKTFIVEAVDSAGNIGQVSVPFRIMHKKKVFDTIRITDTFLERKMPDFKLRYANLKGNLLQVFLQVNTKLRAEDNKKFKELCSNGSKKMLWKGRFLRLPRSAQRANFADYRTYIYKGRKIGTTYHMGVDLASIRHAKVPAGNNGIVVFADYLGIYGNTVIIDHGLGLFSTYSHLSAIFVNKGDQVTKGQIIGRTGETGLAGGDHLHYGMLVNGVFVNPEEWWDGRWIQTHILANM